MKTLGIVAGFGPYAANYFIQRLLTITNAKKEWDQFPFIANFNTQIPSRTRALLYGEASPAPKLIETIKVLEKANTDLIAVPCNSGHGWYEEVSKEINLEWLNIIKITSEAAKKRNIEKALVISAYVPAKLKLYDKYLDNVVYLDEPEMNRIYKLIERLKVNENKEEIKSDLWNVVDHYSSKVDGIIIACTEPSMLFKGGETTFGSFQIVDSTQEYAKKCVEICMDDKK